MEQPESAAAPPSPTELGEASTFLGMGGGLGHGATPPMNVADRVEQARVYGALFGNPTPETLGRYVLVDTLGAGAMGTVLRAFDRELNRTVAIKVLHEHLDERHTARLRREARALAKLSHPNVVQVYEVAEVEGRTFVAMELVEGQTLREWVEQTIPGWRACVEMFIQLGEGLAAAHESGLIHRDFKPSNAIVDDKGRARVLDFGLARSDDEAEPLELPGIIEKAATEPLELAPLEQSLTKTGTVLGTPAYMPPEQMSGKAADARSDQFSFCVSLYEALYGERPYEGGTFQALMLSMMSGTIRPASRGSAVPAGVRKILLRGLAAKPAERWPSTEALLEQLRRQVAPNRGWRWVAGVGVLAAAAALIAVRQTQTVSAQGVEITETKEQLAARVKDLEREKRRSDERLAVQTSLRATLLATTEGKQLEAVRVAVEAFAEMDPQAESTPPPLFEGLTHALTGIDRGVALLGHAARVLAVAVSPDGQYVATASEDGSVRLWDARAGILRHTLEGPEGKAHAVVFSPDGAVLASGIGKAIDLWDARTGQSLGSIGPFAHPNPVRGVAFSPDGTKLVSASGDEAWVWALGGDAWVVALAGHTGRVRSVAWSPDGARLYTASEDRTVRAWDAQTWSSLQVFEGHTDKVFDVAVSADGAHVATGGRDETARVWNSQTGELVAKLEPRQVVYGVAFSPDGTRLATGTFDDGTARVWDVATGRSLATVRHGDAVVDVAFSPDGEQLVTASWDSTARSWDSRVPYALQTLPHPREVDAVAYSPDGTRLATAGADGHARIWDARTGAPVATLKGHGADLLDVAYSPDGTRLATTSWDGSVRLWSTRSNEHLKTLRGHTEPVRAVTWSHDGTRVVTASRDGTARVWDATTGTEQHTVEHGTQVVDALRSVDGARLLTVGADDQVRQWIATTGEALPGQPFDALVTALAFSPDGHRVAIATTDGSVTLRNTSSGEVLATLTGHAAPVRSLAFSPDGAQLATGSEDHTARVWTADPGVRTQWSIRGVFPHQSPVTSVAFSPDGTRLATACRDHAARLWMLQPARWLAWGCAVLESRQGHDESSQSVCERWSAAESSAPLESATTSESAGPLLSAAPDPEVSETKTVHGVELVLIPGGTFMMGSPDGEQGRWGREGPQHEVTLDSFYLARTEVTYTQYALYLDANPEARPPPLWDEENYNQPDQPVIGLDWYEAKAYCDWAGLVLPTEAQWEYAARAGASTAYWFGDDPADLGRFDWYIDNTGAKDRGYDQARPRSVATRGASPWGLFDVHGNLRELTSDAYKPYTLPTRAGDGLRVQPVGSEARIIRGGGWYISALSARAADRWADVPTGRSSDVGLRPAQLIP